mmetsp:Transcript_51042/g.169069  ORF Transcript_51042/g.169069 Transcript_51042/m.169069 type:complete len:161 (-) Transcript_51042:74-556(-)
MRREAARYQCLSDNPWARFWRELFPAGIAAAPPPLLVQTRARSAGHYAVSRHLFEHRFFRQPLLEGDRLLERLMWHVREYRGHLADTRAEAARRGFGYVEVCWACGDGMTAIAAALGVPLGPAVEAALPHANRKPARYERLQVRMLEMLRRNGSREELGS